MLRSRFGRWAVGYIDSPTDDPTFEVLRKHFTLNGARRSRLYRRHAAERGLAIKRH